MLQEDIVIYDDFATASYHKEILNITNPLSFDWKYNPNISSENNTNLEYFGFTHTILNAQINAWVSKHDVIKPLIYQIKDTANCKNILRARFDMTLFNKNNLMHEPHIDFEVPHIASIYYVNDTDGDTIIFNEKKLNGKYTIKKRIQPKANRLVLFKGEFVHTGCSPSKTANRILINSNYN